MPVSTLHFDFLSALHVHVSFLVLYDRCSLTSVLSRHGFLFHLHVFHYMYTQRSTWYMLTRLTQSSRKSSPCSLCPVLAPRMCHYY
jgi:hypothetical protein